MNFRGTNGVQLKVTHDTNINYQVLAPHTPQENTYIAWSGSWTEDCRTAVRHIRALYPLSHIVGLGFSLGSNVIVRRFHDEIGH